MKTIIHPLAAILLAWSAGASETWSTSPAEAMQQAAAELGFTPEQGRQLAIETVQGAAALAAQSSDPASVLRERVTSKGGTTEAALNKMADMGVKAGIIAGVKAAEARGQELGKLLGAA